MLAAVAIFVLGWLICASFAFVCFVVGGDSHDELPAPESQELPPVVPFWISEMQEKIERDHEREFPRDTPKPPPHPEVWEVQRTWNRVQDYLEWTQNQAIRDVEEYGGTIIRMWGGGIYRVDHD